MVRRMTASGEGPESTQLNPRFTLMADLLPLHWVEEDTHGTHRSPAIPAGPRKQFHRDDTRRISDSPLAKRRYGRSQCFYEANIEQAIVGWRISGGTNWRPGEVWVRARQSSEYPSGTRYPRSEKNWQPVANPRPEAGLEPFDVWHSAVDDAVSSCQQYLKWGFGKRKFRSWLGKFGGYPYGRH